MNTQAQDFKARDTVSYNLTVQYQLLPDWPIPDISQLNLSLELVGTTASRDAGPSFSWPLAFSTSWVRSGLKETALEIPISRGLERLFGLKPDVIVI